MERDQARIAARKTPRAGNVQLEFGAFGRDLGRPFVGLARLLKPPRRPGIRPDIVVRLCVVGLDGEGRLTARDRRLKLSDGF